MTHIEANIDTECVVVMRQQLPLIEYDRWYFRILLAKEVNRFFLFF